MILQYTQLIYQFSQYVHVHEKDTRKDTAGSGGLDRRKHVKLTVQSILRAVPVNIRSPPIDSNWKTTPTPPGNLGPWATTEPGFPEFFSTTLPGIFSWLNIVFIYHPRIIWKKGEYETNNIPTSTASMSFLIQKQWDCHLYCRLNLCIRPTIYARRGAHHRGFQFAEFDTTTHLRIKIPHTPEKCQMKPTTPSGKKRLPFMGEVRIFAGTAISTDQYQCQDHLNNTLT